MITDYMLDMPDNCDYLDTDKTFTAKTTDLLILHTNIRGINSKVMELQHICKVLSVPFACVGSGDPVRVLRLYTTNTLDIL